MLDEMKLEASWDYFDYLNKVTGYKSAFATHRETIEAGIAQYNKAIKQTDDDEAEEAALLAERKKAEAPIQAKTKDYAAMKVVVEPWDTLMPAIHNFYNAKRLVQARPPGLDPAAEKDLETKLGLVKVAPGSNESAFDAATLQVEKLRAAHEINATDKSRGVILALPQPYQEMELFQQLREAAGAHDVQVANKAHTDIAAAQTKLAKASDALKLLKTVEAAKPELHPQAWKVLEAMRPVLPGKIAALGDLATEEKQISSALRLEAALASAKNYTAARKKAEDLWAKAALPDVKANFESATAAPKDAQELATKTQSLQNWLTQPRIAYDKAAKQTNVRLQPALKLDPAAGAEGSEVHPHLKAAELAAGKDEFLTALGELELAEKAGKARGGIALKVQAGKAKDAIAELASATDIGPQAREVVALLQRSKSGSDLALPVIGENTNLEQAGATLDQVLRIPDLLEPARRYTAALALAENNRASYVVPGLAAKFKEALTPLPAKSADQVVPSIFNAAIAKLDEVNRLWTEGKAVDLHQRQAEIDIRTLQATFKKYDGTEEEKKDRQKIVFTLLQDRKDAVENAKTLKMAMAAKALDELDTKIAHALDGLVVPLRSAAKALTDGDPALKAVMDRIDKELDENGRDLVATLYQTFGDSLPKLLAGLDTVEDDPDHAKASGNLVELCKLLGTKGLRTLGVTACDGDAEKLGGMMTGVIQKGLAGDSTDEDDKRIANLKKLVEKFGDNKKLSTLLVGLAQGDPAKAGQRMDNLLKRYFGDDVDKLKTPFFDELESQGDAGLPRLIRRAAAFEQAAMPSASARTVDPADVKNLTCRAKRVTHFLNRHTEKHCSLDAETTGPGANVASMWPEGTGVAELKVHLKAAMTTIGAAPSVADLADLPPMTDDNFGQKDVEVKVNGKAVQVRVGFQASDGSVKITQFYPRGGEGVNMISVSDMRAIKRALT